MHIGADFSSIKFVRQEAGLAEEKVECLPNFTVKLIDILEILTDIFPKRLLDIKGILTALVTIHTVQLGSAILTIGIRRCFLSANTLQTTIFDMPCPLLSPLPKISKKYIVFHIYVFSRSWKLEVRI